jgi:hypothetical protein
MSDINYMENIVNGMDKNTTSDAVKRIKSEKGLIERTESSKIILSEDNRQVLLG